MYSELVRSAILAFPDETTSTDKLVRIIRTASTPEKILKRRRACSQLAENVAYRSPASQSLRNMKGNAVSENILSALQKMKRYR